LKEWAIGPIVLGTCLMLVVPIGIVGLGSAGKTAQGPSDPIRHIVILMMENHAYDNYFGDYCLQSGPQCSTAGLGVPVGTCVPEILPKNLTNHCATMYAEPWSAVFASNGGAHGWKEAHVDYNNGGMNNFYVGQGGNNIPFGEYNGSTLPFYWDLAEQYGLADHFFSSAMSYSMPNHWYLIAGQAPFPVQGPGTIKWDDDNTTSDHTYLDAANGTPTIADELQNHTYVSWTYYDWPLINYSTAITLYRNVNVAGSAYTFFNPFAGKAEDYYNNFSTHFVPRNNFFGNAKNGTLPNISWIIPGKYDDHPPGNLTRGESFIASVVDAVESSPDWNTTALFISWDDYGGYYDNVVPPVIDHYGYGFRVPMILVSPYARENYIENENLSFDSLLSFEENQFGLGCLTSRDCNANLPLGMFNFSMPPRPPMMFSTSWTHWKYPMPLQSQSAPWQPVGGFTPSAYALDTSFDGATEQD
jgi:phospholipase C